MSGAEGIGGGIGEGIGEGIGREIGGDRVVGSAGGSAKESAKVAGHARKLGVPCCFGYKHCRTDRCTTIRKSNHLHENNFLTQK